jgi:hypothetical protein
VCQIFPKLPCVQAWLPLQLPCHHHQRGPSCREKEAAFCSCLSKNLQHQKEKDSAGCFQRGKVLMTGGCYLVRVQSPRGWAHQTSKEMLALLPSGPGRLQDLSLSLSLCVCVCVCVCVLIGMFLGQCCSPSCAEHRLCA